MSTLGNQFEAQHKNQNVISNSENMHLGLLTTQNDLDTWRKIRLTKYIGYIHQPDEAFLIIHGGNNFCADTLCCDSHHPKLMSKIAEVNQTLKVLNSFCKQEKPQPDQMQCTECDDITTVRLSKIQSPESKKTINKTSF